MMKNKAVFLDRDGVLSKKLKVHHYIFSLEELKRNLFQDIQGPLRQLKEQGYLLIIVTNQSAINKKLITREEYSSMVGCLKTFGIDEVYTCPHNPLKEDCNCRKPKTGMLEQASIDYNIDFQNSWLIGDEASDIQAGNLAGCKTIQILAGHDHDGLIREANFIARNLSEAANYILEYTNK